MRYAIYFAQNQSDGQKWIISHFDMPRNDMAQFCAKFAHIRFNGGGKVYRAKVNGVKSPKN